MLIKNNNSGFTLVEVLTMVAIIGILATIAIPNYLSLLPGIRLKATARDLYSNLQKAKMRAIKENRSISVRFDRTGNPGYYYFDLDGDGAYTAGEYQVNLSEYNDVDFGNGNATTDWNDNPPSHATVITYSPNGTANSASVYLDNLRNASDCYAVTSQISGSLKLRRYSNNNWN